MDGLIDAAKAMAARSPGEAKPRDFDEWILCMMGKVDCTIICIGKVYCSYLGGDIGERKRKGKGTGRNGFANYEVLWFQGKVLQTYS